MQQGDTVTVTAYGLYQQSVQHGFFFSLASWLTGLLQPAQAPPAGLDGRTRRDLPLLQVGVGVGLLPLQQASGGVPQGYVRLLVFNRDSALVEQQVQPLSQGAQNNWETLSIRVIVPQDGYVSAYVGNGSEVDVLFDDVNVEHRPGLQVQEVQYDPAGLELAGLAPASPGIKGLNHYRFNGKELQQDLGLNWNHQDWRFFDSQLLRWHSVDPELENGQESWTPYSFGYDNAVRFADANGRAPGDGFMPPPGGFKPFGTIRQRQPNTAEKISSVLHAVPFSGLAMAYDAANTAYGYGTGFFDHSKAHTFEGYGLTQKEYQIAAVSTLLLFGSEGMGATSRSAAMAGAVEIDPSRIRFSQNSVTEVADIQASMASKGWKGKPIDVVSMPDGKLTTLDNTRVLAASRTGVRVQARIHGYKAPLPHGMAERFPAKGRSASLPSTYGEAVSNRIQRQSSGYRAKYPSGSQITGSAQ